MKKNCYRNILIKSFFTTAAFVVAGSALALDAITQTEMVDDGKNITVTVTADDEFYVGSQPWILEIGNMTFVQSGYVEGTLRKLQFSVPNDQMANSFKDGDSVSVKYGHGNTGKSLKAAALQKNKIVRSQNGNIAK